MNDLPNSDFAIIVVREALRGVWTKIEKKWPVQSYLWIRNLPKATLLCFLSHTLLIVN